MRPLASPAAVSGALPLAGFYALYFAGVGIIQPFLPAWLQTLGLSATEVGLLLALGPTLALVGPPLWGWVADHTGRPERVLTVLSLGAAASFSALLWTERLALLALAYAFYGLFYTGVTPLIDSLTLQHVALRGGAFSHVRLFGSLGFIASSLGFGLASPQLGRATVAVPLALMAGYGLWSLTLRSTGPAATRRPSPLAGLALLGQRDLAFFLAATCLHWMALAPFQTTFGIHVLALGLPTAVVGLGAALGVAGEVVAMLLYPRLAEAIAPRHLLALAFGLSALRWAGMAVATGGPMVVALQLLHAFTFGVFYVAAVSFVSRRVPVHVRASGQALFAAVTFGVGGLVGYATSGRLYDALGGAGLFLCAAAVEVVAALLVLQVGPPHAQESAAE